MQIILHYSYSKCPCRFKHFWGHLDSSNYLGPHCSIMNKVFCTSKVCAQWAFKSGFTLNLCIASCAWMIPTCVAICLRWEILAAPLRVIERVSERAAFPPTSRPSQSNSQSSILFYVFGTSLEKKSSFKKYCVCAGWWLTLQGASPAAAASLTCRLHPSARVGFRAG